MLQVIATVAVPAVTFVLMLIVGLDLKIADFLRVARYPQTVAVALTGHIVLLPLMAVAIILAIKPPDSIAAALVFLALSPGGALSNYYTQLAGRNVALSITLTAVNTLTSLLSIPLIAAAALFGAGLGDTVRPVPADRILLQLGLFVIFPAAIGMWTGSRFETAIRPWQSHLRLGSLVLLAALLLFSILDLHETLSANITDLFCVAALFVAGAMLVGVVISWAVPAAERPVVVIETAVRNIPVAILLGSGLASDAVLVSFLACYLLVEIAVLVPYAAIVRWRLSVSAV